MDITVRVNFSRC